MKRANFPGRKLARKLRHIAHLQFTELAIGPESPSGDAEYDALMSLPVNRHGKRPHERDTNLREWLPGRKEAAA